MYYFGYTCVLSSVFEWVSAFFLVFRFEMGFCLYDATVKHMWHFITMNHDSWELRQCIHTFFFFILRYYLCVVYAIYVFFFYHFGCGCWYFLKYRFGRRKCEKFFWYPAWFDLESIRNILDRSFLFFSFYCLHLAFFLNRNNELIFFCCCRKVGAVDIPAIFYQKIYLVVHFILL